MKNNTTITHTYFLAVLFFCGCLINAQETFVDVTEHAGIEHQYEVYEGTFGGGVTVFDFNNDGFEDLYITSGIQADRLYLNKGNGTFEDVFKGSGLEVTNEYVTQGVVSADINKDGFRDLFITTITTTDGKNVIPRAKNLLFLNNGNATFTNVTKAYGLEEFNSFSTGPSFGDIDADGYPDLFVGNYFQEFTGKLGIIKDATIVSANQTARSYLLKNNEGKSFKNVYDDYGLGHKGFGFGGVFTDFDNDQDQDLLVNQDFGYKAVPNFLYQNEYPNDRFEDVSQQTEMDLKINAMGAAVGDYNGDGWMDYYVTNIKFNMLMENQGNGNPFVDKAKELGTYNLAISWGANFADFDHDEDLDLFVSNGDLNPNCTPMGNFYFENNANTYTEKGRELAINDYGIGRGSVIFDMDNDGDMDLLVVNQKPILNYPIASTTRLFRNDIATGNWLKIALKGVQAESNGIGSRVTVIANGKKFIREIDGGGSSHISQNSVIAHVGLGTTTKIDSVIVNWSGGNTQIITNIKANQLLEIVETAQPKKPLFNFWYFIGALFLIITVLYIYRNKRS
ncbi:MAG TPA: CRTAC1 family protein [Maribacter sp.]|uniref:CRTAC1 family protein n=2 Tax=Maribacter TaxID=252356 RepID=UPI000ECEF0F3|nr:MULTISPECIES: CRTAC1 family protein [unclassified Maribacter]HAF79079.1 CRTAC1 family protein [Maribacter sp.]|tara:strand:+ start:48854 stop:50548 length:1695 start_codon:yes stop_codon:yes gene_type:complete